MKKNLESISLSFASLSAGDIGVGEREFFELVQAQKDVEKSEKSLATAREKRENSTTAFLKKIGAYDAKGKPTKQAIKMGPSFVTDWIEQFFPEEKWPMVQRPGREPEKASIRNDSVAELFESAEYKALCRAYSALSVAISDAKKGKKGDDDAKKGDDDAKKGKKGDDDADDAKKGKKGDDDADDAKKGKKGDDADDDAKKGKKGDDGDDGDDADDADAKKGGKKANDVAATATKKAVAAQHFFTLQWVLEQIADSEDLEELETTIKFALKKAKRKMERAA